MDGDVSDANTHWEETSLPANKSAAENQRPAVQKTTLEVVFLFKALLYPAEIICSKRVLE
jgi:hypothetical protein